MHWHPYYTFTNSGAAPPAAVLDGSGLRFLRGRRVPKLDPEEVRREQRMVDEYLAALDRQRNASERIERAPARTKKRLEAETQAAVPQLTEAMARAASDRQIQRILEAAAAREEDRRKARAEFERRYWAAFLVLAMNE